MDLINTGSQKKEKEKTDTTAPSGKPAVGLRGSSLQQLQTFYCRVSRGSHAGGSVSDEERSHILRGLTHSKYYGYGYENIVLN